MGERLGVKELGVRNREDAEARRVVVRLTAAGEKVLEELSGMHQEELRCLAPDLIAALETVLEDRGASASRVTRNPLHRISHRSPHDDPLSAPGR